MAVGNALQTKKLEAGKLVEEAFLPRNKDFHPTRIAPVNRNIKRLAIVCSKNNCVLSISISGSCQVNASYVKYESAKEF